MTDLREHLFDAIAGVRNGTLSVEQARMIVDISQTVVNTAKVEVEALRVTGGLDSPFLIGTSAGGSDPSKQLPNGITAIRRHVLRDD
jgi:hypothetical protein